MRERFAERLGKQRPLVRGVFLFCLFMTFLYMPYDFLVKPFTQGIERAEEVWFGFMLRGAAAKATEPLHWIVYASLSYGFWRDRPWVWPLSALYALQVAIGMAVWSVLYADRSPWLAVAIGCPFLALSVALWRARAPRPGAV